VGIKVLKEPTRQIYKRKRGKMEEVRRIMD